MRIPIMKSKKQSNALVQSRRQRYDEITAHVKALDDVVRKWPILAKEILEVEEEKLFTEGGYETMSEWLKTEAPASERLCRLRKANYKALSPHFSDKELLEMPPETAAWASRIKNISPAAFEKLEVRAALTLPKKEAIAEIQMKAPDQHVEQEVIRHCKFAVSEANVIQECYEAFKALIDEKTSFEQFLEACISAWFDSPANEDMSFRQRWEELKEKRNEAKTMQYEEKA